MPSDFAPATLTISLDAIAANYKIFQSNTSGDVAGVLKANAYGTGAEEVFKTLRGLGCKNFFIATPDEGEQLRKLDKDVSIYLLGGVQKDTFDFLISQNITPILHSFEEMAVYGAAVKNTKLPAILHFDTGMNRLGFGHEEMQKLLSDLSVLTPFNLQYVMSHFVASEVKDSPLNARQAQDFSAIAAHFPQVKKSLCNSSGIFRNKGWHYDLVRPGFSMYGGNPTPETTNPVRSVVTLEAKILQTLAVKKGETAGYNHTYTFEKDTTTATLGIGYADGFLRSGSNRAKFYWNGQPCPIRGRVSMDLIIVEIGHLTGKPPQIGDTMEILGPHQNVDQLANDCQTNGYEILTSLGPRYKRVYV